MPLSTLLSKPEALPSIWLFPIAVLCLYCFFCLHVAHLISPFRHLPTPKQGPIWLRLLHEPNTEEIEKWIDELPHEGLIRYHGIFNRERIFVASPDAAKDLLATNAYKFGKIKLVWILAHRIAGVGLLLLEGKEHKEARKQFNPAFSPAQMKKSFPSMWKTTAKALDVLPHLSKQTVPYQADAGINATMEGVVSILPLISAASIDMMGQFGFSIDFDTLNTIVSQKSKSSVSSKNPMYKFGRLYVHMFKTTPRGQNTLWAASLIGPTIALKLPLPAVKTIAGIMKVVRKTAEDIVISHEHKYATKDEEKPIVGDDMLTLLMKSGHFSHQGLVEQTTHFFAAATETLIGTFGWVIHLISRHPDIQTRLREEIRANIPSPYKASAEVSNSQFHNLKYLNAVIEEVLRYHSINTLLWRDCIEPATIAGVSIPKGTTVVFSPWALNRDPAYWGPDARSFRPERWLEHPSGGASRPYSFLTFGGGPRRCVGEQYARDELLSLTAGLFGRYEFTPLNPDKSTDEGNEIGDNYALTLFKVLEGWEINVKKVPGW